MVTKFSAPHKLKLYSLLLGGAALFFGIIVGLMTAIVSGSEANFLGLLAICGVGIGIILALLYRFRLQDHAALGLQAEQAEKREALIAASAAPATHAIPPQFYPPWLMQRLEVKPDWLEWCLLLLIFMVYTRFSDVLVHEHSLPSVAQPLVLLLLVVLVGRGVVARSKGKKNLFGPRWITVSILLGSYGLVRFASLLYAADLALAQEALGDYVKDAIIAVVVVLILQRGAMLRRAIWALLIAGMFMGTISAIQFLTGAFHNTFLGFGLAQVQHIIGQTEDFRIGGPIGEPNFYSQILLPLVPLAFERMWNERKLLLRLLAGWSFIACLLAIVFTFSRGAIVGLGAMVGVMLLIRRPTPQELLIAFLIMLPILPFVPTQYIERVTTLVDVLPGFNNDPRSEVSFRGRTSELIAGLMMFRDNPLLGVGLNNYPVHYQNYARRVGLETRREPRAPHSLYLEVLAELGFLGVVTFGALLWNMSRSIYLSQKKFRRYRFFEYGNLTAALGVGLVGYLTAAIFLHAAYPRFFWLLVGITLAIPQIARNEQGLVYGNQ